MFDLDELMIDVPCPVCTYAMQVTLVDIRTQAYRWCSCCRSRIALREPDGSISVSIREFEDEMNSLDKKLRRLFG